MFKDPRLEVITDESKAPEQKARHRFTRQTELDDMNAVLSAAAGKRFLTRLLIHCKVHSSVWSPSAMIHRDAGVQEVGHFILSEMIAANPEKSAQILTEAYQSALSTKTHKENR